VPLLTQSARFRAAGAAVLAETEQAWDRRWRQARPRYHYRAGVPDRAMFWPADTMAAHLEGMTWTRTREARVVRVTDGCWTNPGLVVGCVVTRWA